LNVCDFAKSSTGRMAQSASLLFVEEISHRVINEYARAIATLSLASSRSRDPETKVSLAHAIDRLHASAATHRSLQAPLSIGKQDLADHLEGVCGSLCLCMLAEKNITLTLNPQPIVLEPTVCWTVGLIVAELVSNSVRHGVSDGGAIRVQIASRSQEVICIVSDNGGCGTDPAPGRGRTVVQGLAAMLGGSVQWRFAAHGVAATLAFPL
jgi:two-component sensor histidine kinase